MPACAIQKNHRMRAGRDSLCDLRQVQGHGPRGAAGQDETGPLALGRTDRAEDGGRCGPLVLRRCGSGAAFRPAPGDRVLLPDTRLVGKPDLSRPAASLTRCDLLQEGGEPFLKAATAASSWAWWRGRAESLREFIARSSRLSVCLEMVMRNSSHTQ